MLFDAHWHGLGVFGGIPKRGIYDNLRIAFDRVGNRYGEFGVEVRSGFSDLGVWCDHPGQRHREHESAGRPIYTMSRELELVAGRLCDSPGCAESANP